MRYLLVLVGLLLPLAASAESIFDTFWDEAESSIEGYDPSQEIIDFVIESAKTWNGHGVIITEDDIPHALSGNTSALCKDKQDTEGNKISFANGSAVTKGSCSALLHDIQDLIKAERVAEVLADDLLSLAVGSELATAAEPRDMMDIPTAVQGIKRLWQGSGVTVLPWNTAADDALRNLISAIRATEEGELPKAMIRFHHGLARDIFEEDPRFAGIGNEIRDALFALASVLGTNPDDPEPKAMLTPTLDIDNIQLWVRTDDLGLLWIAPTKQHRLSLKLPEDYPVYHESGDRLAYPFAYEGPHSLFLDTESPLCSRPMGARGYLCRAVPDIDTACRPSDPNTISLVDCTESSDPEIVDQTISACLDLYPIYQDNDDELFRSDGSLNPGLTPAAAGTICQPESKVQYPAGIMTNLCYSDACLRESMSGHSLFPGRNPTLAYESTSPYLACVRPDPELGLFTESMKSIPTPLPSYLGTELVTDFVGALCQVTGSVPHPLAGYCMYQQNLRSAVPTAGQLEQLTRTTTEGANVVLRSSDMHSLAANVGLRQAIDQSVQTHRNALQPLATFLTEIASLFRELERAPLTTAACPWTGPINTTSTP